MSPTLRGSWRRFRIRIAHLTAGGSWAVQLSDATQRNLRNFFFDGLFSSANDSITLTYLTLFVLSLGASSSEIGLMAALASISATMLLIPGAMLVDRVGNRKKIVLISGGLASNVCILLMAGIPLIIKGRGLIYVAISLKVIMDGLRNFSLPAWVSMTGDVIPLSWRGRYFATRNLIMGFAAMVVTYGIGQVITWLGEPVGYQWSLLLAFVFGITSTSFFARIRDYRDKNQEIPRQSYSLQSLFQTLKGDRNFLAFCLFTGLWTFSLNIAGPFFNVFLVKDLGATASIIGVVAVVGKITSMPAQRYFGPLVDRWGARRLIRLMAFFIPILPFSWYFVQAPWQAIPINALGGILWAGMNLASFNLLLDISPQEQRARYSAMYQIAVALSAAIGAFLGGFIADHWGIRFVFLLSALGRFFSANVFAKFVHQPPSKPAGLLPQSN
jgi:MFS family permease